jgi:hypothetical protein
LIRRGVVFCGRSWFFGGGFGSETGAVVLFLEREEKCEEKGETEDGQDDY